MTMEIKFDNPWARAGANGQPPRDGGSGGGAESAVPGTATYVRCVCVSATSWIANMFDADGDEAKLPAASA